MTWGFGFSGAFSFGLFPDTMDDQELSVSVIVVFGRNGDLVGKNTNGLESDLRGVFLFFLRFFFFMWIIFKVFIEFVTIFLLFDIFVFWPRGMWNLSSPTRD